MIRNKILVLLALLLLTLEVNAQNNVWTDSNQIKAVQVMSNGAFIIILDTDKSAVCLRDEHNMIGFSPYKNGVSDTGAKSLLSAALIAFTTENKIKVQYAYSIESDYCWGKTLYLAK